MGNPTEGLADETYNGWTNYATWLVALHLDNDHGTYSYVREIADELRDPSVWPDGELPEDARDIAYALAERIEQFVDEITGLDDGLGVPEPNILVMDLLRTVLRDVDWREIADNVLAE